MSESRVRRLVGWVVLGAFAFVVLLFVSSLSEPARTPERPVGTGDAARDPVLQGTGVSPVGEFATVTDLGALLPRASRGSAAEARLLELVEADPGRLAGLVEWFHPDHDAERPGRPLPGQSSSGTAFSLLRPHCETFRHFGAAGVDALASGLAHENAVVRARVAHCLGNLGAFAAAAAPAIAARLEGGREDVASQVVMLRALGAMGTGAKDALPVFHAYLRDESLSDDARAAAAQHFLDVAGPTDEALATCAAALRDQSFEVCMNLLPAIARLGPEAAPLLPELFNVVADEYAHVSVAGRAMMAIRGVGAADRTTVALLLRVAADDQRPGSLRLPAALAVSSLGEEAVDDLLATIAASDDESRLLLVNALRESEIDRERLLPLLEPVRASQWEDERSRAVFVASRLGVQGEALVEWVRPWMGDAHANVRCSCLDALRQTPLQGEGAASLLADGLEDPSDRVRDNALCVLWERWDRDLGDRAHLCQERIVDGALRMLEAEDGDVRARAAEALDRVAPERSEAALAYWIGKIHNAFGWPDRAVAVVTRLGPRAKEAVPVLEALRERWKDHAEVRAKAEAALTAIRGH